MHIIQLLQQNKSPIKTALFLAFINNHLVLKAMLLIFSAPTIAATLALPILVKAIVFHLSSSSRALRIRFLGMVYIYI